MRFSYPVRLSLVALVASLTLAALLLTPQMTQALPPWPTLTATAASSDGSARAAAGGQIVLSAASAPLGAWGMAQWADAGGQWHDVTGWQGPLDETGQLQRWVDPVDFGQGPFRWVVYATRDGRVWGISSNFALPDSAGGIRHIEIGASATPTAPPVSPWAFTLLEKVVYQTYAAGCGQYAITGQVFNRAGRPLSGYRLRLTHPSGDQETIVSGGAPNFGSSGFAFLLGRRKPNRLYTLELLSPDAQTKLTAPVSIVFSGDCSQNTAGAIFRESAP